MLVVFMHAPPAPPRVSQERTFRRYDHGRHQLRLVPPPPTPFHCTPTSLSTTLTLGLFTSIPPPSTPKQQRASRQLRRLLPTARVGRGVAAAVGDVPAVHGPPNPPGGDLRARVMRLPGVPGVLREAPRNAPGPGRARALRRPGAALESLTASFKLISLSVVARDRYCCETTPTFVRSLFLMFVFFLCVQRFCVSGWE